MERDLEGEDLVGIGGTLEELGEICETRLEGGIVVGFDWLWRGGGGGGGEEEEERISGYGEEVER